MTSKNPKAVAWERRAQEERLYDWISARLLRLSCARTLAGFSCEYAERGSGEPGDDGVPRCYLSGNEEVEWCENCQKRNRLYPGLARLRKLERLAFRRLCRSAERFKRAHDGTAECARNGSSAAATVGCVDSNLNEPPKPVNLMDALRRALPKIQA